ncbi:hypothetical protein [Gordonia neofelifaecis]|uniref:Transmembrane protein n=1 Tax=Gordonia neofelifaecis NRRL B-59395 TaxID=644548 RepID=F1YMN2_9ACTN|nr:hypothetical protein [Gordonia neofelifaecis]EGD53967.1 hypothetical protein SCNU_15889 [Gordonia neofelifaecis NRRL B-59395]
MTAAPALAVAGCFIWLGLVVGISFIEAPLKFQAPGITIPLGLGIGRLVFRALNAVEMVWAAVLIVTVVVGDGWSITTEVALGIAVAALIVQVAAIRPVLSKRTDAVLANPEAVPDKRSTAHYWYVGFDLIKVAALIALGTSLLLNA